MGIEIERGAQKQAQKKEEREGIDPTSFFFLNNKTIEYARQFEPIDAKGSRKRGREPLRWVVADDNSTTKLQYGAHGPRTFSRWREGLRPLLEASEGRNCLRERTCERPDVFAHRCPTSLSRVRGYEEADKHVH